MSGQQGLEGRVAVIGMAGRFPGADTVVEFWQRLCDGSEGITFFEDDQLDDWFDREARSAPNYVKARPILEDVDQFDAGFFGMHAREAALTDPQHRVFLECAWQALEDAGYDPVAYDGAIGVFAGCSMNTYFLNNICRDRRVIDEFTSNFQVGAYQTLLGAGREFLATRVSYKLDLKGPSLTLQTACSTSLVAVAQACQSLLLYQADMALAGGVSITFPQHRGYLHQEGGMVSADGRCRPFDAAASGTIFGSGAGVVLLKRLDEAIADRDHIYAVILGCGVNNDGAAKVGFTAPSIDGQAAAIEQALAQAGVDARSIGYVECHGTATPLGDPIEIAALTKAFRRTTAALQYCAIGSVKGNIGHLDAAAGVTGLIKTALMLRHSRFVPSLHFRHPNPQIDFAGSPFFVAAEAAEWTTGSEPRRAGVSSLGVGGTNAHVVLEQRPAPDGETGSAERTELLVLSARSASALVEMRSRLADHLRAFAGQPLADIAFTLQRGRRHFPFRWAAVCKDRAAAVAALAQPDDAPFHHGDAAGQAPPVVFMFPGQGAQYPNMAGGLYRRFPVFRREIERCAEILGAFGVDLIDALYGGADAAQAERLALTGTAQPAIFSVEYALARLWRSWGIEAQAFVGHSVGEFVAACLAGVFSLPDALGLVAARGRLMEGLPRGGMISVRLGEDEVAPFLGARVSLAAVNGPAHCVLAGDNEALADIEARLVERGILHRRLRTSHAFHSAMMDPMIEPFAEHVAEIALAEPRVPYVSGVTGSWIRPDEATSREYWARHAREPVRFAAAIRTLTASASPMLLEVGPGNTLTTLALLTARNSAGRVVSSLPDASGQPADEESALAALGRLWVAGVVPDWRTVADGPRARVPLPTYPFERRGYWIDPPARTAAVPASVEMPEPDAADIATDERVMNASPSAAGPDGSADVPPDDIRRSVLAILEEVSGDSVAPEAASATFLEMGFDSLLLSQVAQRLQSQLKVKIAFRQLLGESVDNLVIGQFHPRADAGPGGRRDADRRTPPGGRAGACSRPRAVGGGCCPRWRGGVRRRRDHARPGRGDVAADPAAARRLAAHRVGGGHPCRSDTNSRGAGADRRPGLAPVAGADAAPVAVPGLSAGAEARRQQPDTGPKSAYRRADGAVYREDRGIETADGQLSRGVGGPAGGGGVSPGMEGARLSDRGQALERLAHLGYRRERIYRPRQRLWSDRVRAFARISSSMRSGNSWTRGLPSGRKPSLPAKIAAIVHRDDRQRAHDLLQYRLGSGHGGIARRPRRDRTIQGRTVWRRLSRSVRRGAGQGGEAVGRHPSLGADRRGHPSIRRRERHCARLRDR